MNIIRNPLTRKRFYRFKQRRSAWISLWGLLVLYLVSLCAEIICNDKPLFVRFEGTSYSPVFRYYPEDTFLHNGRITRPNYKMMNQSSPFIDNPSNVMIFPPVPFGPNESLDPSELIDEESVLITCKPVPAIASIDITPDMTIAKSSQLSTILRDTVSLRADQRWHFSPQLLDAIELRFKNEAAPEMTTTLQPVAPCTPTVSATLTDFNPRRRPPRTVRLRLQHNQVGSHPPWQLIYRNQQIENPPAPWQNISANDRQIFREKAQNALKMPQSDIEIRTDDGTAWAVHFSKQEIRWPYKPTRRHFMGIDGTGRDVFARILYGMRTSLTFGFLLAMGAMGAGAVIGAFQGYLAGLFDLAAQRIIEIWSSLPFLYIMILLGSVYGRSFALLLLCYGLFNWIGVSYYIRGEFLKLRKQPFVDAAQCQGLPARRIIFIHILPNALTPIITFFPFSLVGAIGSLAALDYLGFGLPPPTASWGELLHQAQTYRWAWWLILYPSLALFIVMILGVFIGEGLRDAYDPKPFSRIE